MQSFSRLASKKNCQSKTLSEEDMAETRYHPRRFVVCMTTNHFENMEKKTK